MRLWSLHPRYLDAQGLVALWREALLAQAVLHGRARGYTRHPQLVRFRQAAQPAAALTAYLRGVHAEAANRGYRFDAARIAPANAAVETIAVTDGQLRYEWQHLRAKLAGRSPVWLARLDAGAEPQPHPLFRVVTGPVAEWEVGATALRHRQITFGSADYRAAVDLREAVLRRPLGRGWEPGAFDGEELSFHLGCFVGVELVAVLVLRPVDGETLHLRQLAVDPDHQGQGIGRALLAFAERLAREHGYRRLVAQARESAVGFYRRLGWEVRGEPFVHLGLDHREVRKELARP